jgi:serine/threonine-protein kinase HipA
VTDTIIDVDVVINGTDVHAGTLYAHFRRGTESATFSYATSYLARDDAYALDPALPMRSGALQTPVGRKLFGAFTDCAPDRWGRRLITRQATASARAEGRTPGALTEGDYLIGVRDDLRQGALRFRIGLGPHLADDATGVPALTDLPSLLDLADRAESDEATLAELRRLVRAGSSLGGARPKAHVLDQDGKIAIAKFPSAANDTWDVMAWEKVALDLAESAGITVPRSRLLAVAGRNVLIVDRFDRTPTGGRIGYASAMTMLEANDGDQASFLDLADVIEQRSANATGELLQLWRRAVYSVLIANTDNHLRNHGFLHEHHDVWRLAPAFDLNPDPAPGSPAFATSLDGTGDDTIETALQAADLFRLTADQADSELTRIASAVSQWRSIAAGHGVAATKIEEMAPAFAALGDVPTH